MGHSSQEASPDPDGGHRGAVPAAGLDLLIDIRGRGGLRKSVEDALRSAVRSGRLVAGTRLPSTRDLSGQLGVARGTVTQAYSQLVAEGWLVAAAGGGTRVTENAIAPDAGPDLPPAQARGAWHDLRPGRPDVAAFPRAAWIRAVGRVVRDSPAEVFDYTDPRGRPELRAALAGYLARVRGVRVRPEHLVVCSGYTQALHLLTGVFAARGAGTAAVEDPAMPDHAAIVGGRLRVLDVPVDDEGMTPAGLADADVVVCTPAHQFPLGVSMSPERRNHLLALARARRTWIVEDDYDGEFRYDRHPLGALQPHAPDRVAYVGSTSKSLGPAVRLGWIACPPSLVDDLAAAKLLADRQTGSLDQLALAELIRSGDYDRHLRASRLAYRRRRDTLVRAVADRLPGARVTGIAAGLHAILDLPGEDQVDLVARLRSASVRVQALGAYTRSTTSLPPGLVIGYATPPGHAYSAAIGALLDVLAG
ncbi:PLP-dependent aminotransferase family protein [Umezawaea sp. Da 62-37]|uniref:MocR-like pyridoxine biosynthesis transcription factor PdxR n=1 Tax=Umezawaea sp. Da 62-37 TaxID=3075927 RepID=UPI0028F7145A|nr:PLP-dependent aminotransferase family protein [Umezawaea sp. Da 62-37]WNV87801.1 PLP-dependent aminotransferase family protein [Umezawaea sp. Da 62-37]